jgi:hypothetical protein
MNTSDRWNVVSLKKLMFICGFILFTFSACDQSTPIPITPTYTFSTPTETASPTLPFLITATVPCDEELTFLSDITIPDNSVVLAGSSLDKQWSVQNSGTCNWDNHYRLHLINGVALGASSEQALYPARAGTQATIRILFSAPKEPGVYTSEWQAFDPAGIPFGDSFFIKVIVQQ